MSSREARRVVHRFVDRSSDRLNALPTNRDVVATVSGVDVGAAGVTTVTWRGADVTAAGKNANYTPVVGDRVKCSLINDQLFIDYAIDGQP